MLNDLAIWIAATPLSTWIMSVTWLWPAAEVLHFVGLSLVIGIAGFFDLRLMGLFREFPVSGVHRLIPWAIVGFAINLVTGCIFFIGTPGSYVGNPAFYVKMLAVLLAGANALLFERLVSDRALAVGAGELAPTSARLIAAASLGSWLLVLVMGRMLPYVGSGAF